MRKSSLWKFVFVFHIFLIGLLSSPAWAQVREEFEDRKPARIEIESLEREVIQKKEAKRIYKLLSILDVSATYDTNPRLTAIRKGDTSGNVRYSLLFKRPLTRGLFITLNYNFDGTAYSEYNQLTNFLNHTRFSVDKSLSKFLSFGTGYDFSSFYYPDDVESDFYFHKFFAYLKHQINKKMYHQLMLEEGFKDYVHSRAYADSITTFQDVDRRDYRHGVEYGLGLSLMEKVFFRLRTKFSINDSNARFQDYYDYKSLDVAPYINYRISEKYLLNLSMTVTKRDYKSREVASQTYAREDLTYLGNIGVRYNLNKNNILSLGYGYNQSNSNDPATEYSGSSVNCGWQHQF